MYVAILHWLKHSDYLFSFQLANYNRFINTDLVMSEDEIANFIPLLLQLMDILKVQIGSFFAESQITQANS